jgi:hypothetical protein
MEQDDMKKLTELLFEAINEVRNDKEISSNIKAHAIHPLANIILEIDIHLTKKNLI